MSKISGRVKALPLKFEKQTEQKFDLCCTS